MSNEFCGAIVKRNLNFSDGIRMTLLTQRNNGGKQSTARYRGTAGRLRTNKIAKDGLIQRASR